MKKFLTVFFVILGVIFTLIIIALTYLWIADPYNLKPLFQSSGRQEMTSTDESRSDVYAEEDLTVSVDAINNDKHPDLTEGQENALEFVGINPEAIPKKITPEQEQCLITKMGIVRVEEIKAGATPTVVEIFVAKNCL